jgi:hypothetical protein
MSEAVGGTKLPRRNVQQIPQQGQQQMPPQQQMGGQPTQEQIQQMQQQRQMMQQQQMQQQQMQQQSNFQNNTPQARQETIVNRSVPSSIKSGKKKFCFSMNDTNVKNATIVFAIFILLNSKIIWRTIARLPMMGTLEPSILALIVNSILAGIIFYIVSSKMNKN